MENELKEVSNENKEKCVSEENLGCELKNGQNTQNWNGLTVGEKMSKIRKYITVEPLLACYLFPSVLAILAVQNMNLEKACRVNQNYGDEICTKLINQNVTNLTEELKIVQTLVAKMNEWKSPLQTSVPALVILFIGAWSDRTGRRRPCMLLPIIGELVTSIGLIFCTYYFTVWPLELAGVIEALPPALTGGWTTMFMAVFSYISDHTSLEDRTFRIGIVNVFVSVSAPIGTALSGILTKVCGYYGVFSISICIYIIGFCYGCFRIKDTLKIQEKNDNIRSGNFCTEFFNPRYVKDTFMVAFRTRNGSRRLRVMLLMLVFVTQTGPIHGELSVVYLYARHRYKFTEVDYSVFATYSVVMNLIGTLIAISLFSRYLKMDDSLIGALAGVSKIAAGFVYAFAPTKAWYYVAPVVDMISGLGIITMRSIASKLVEPNETGKIHSLFGVVEAVVPLIYTPMYSRVYILTFDSLPGTFYLLGGLLTIPAIAVYMWMYILQKRDDRKEKRHNAEISKDNFSYINTQIVAD